MVTLKSPTEIAAMRAAGRAVADTLRVAAAAAAPGVRLRDLDALAAAHMADLGGTPSFLGYQPTFAPNPFPGVLCLSVDEVIAHGIPNDYVLRAGDLLSIDCGVVVDGYHGDAAVTVPIGEVPPAAAELSDVTRRALAAGVASAVPGGRLGDISAAIEKLARDAGYGLTPGFGGHGIGRAMHEDPDVPNAGRPGRGMRLREGLVLAVEPMFLEGGRDEYRIGADGWSLRTVDGGRAAHWEHTVAITTAGPVVLTAP